MITLPVELMNFNVTFAPLFSKHVWENAQVLIAGAILAPGKRTVMAALRVLWHSANKNFQSHRSVLNRAVWSPLIASRLLLGLLITTFTPTGTIVCGLDDTSRDDVETRSKLKRLYADLSGQKVAENGG
ncbi:MAG: transposase [Pyrinomonadaceae bacterium]|nr:transposase [Pyrinomonadaceae bacterium]